MAILKCKMCGGDLNVTEGVSVCECEYCGTKQTIPNVDDEKKLVQFERAERLRKQCEFDKAAGIYETIVADFRQEAEAYWGLVLCKYGIEYVDDPATGKKIPTCHRSSFDSVMEDSDFEQTLENADEEARRVYRQEAKAIETLRKGIISVSVNEQPYDIFICYKETDSAGERTLDSVLAQDMYDILTAKGYRVFFSRISLEDKLGMEYEPYIFAALNSAKIMLAVGTDYEHYSAVWVKNEWSRFLKLMTKDKEKHLIPCYKGIDAYDMPREFIKLQAQDMGKVGAMQDLLRGIEKILGASAPKQEPVVVGNGQIAALLKRVYIFLEDNDWNNANEYCEKVLDIDPECGEAYLAKLMVELRVRNTEELKNCALPFDQYGNYQKALRFSDAVLRAELQGYVDFIVNRNQNAVYTQAVQMMEKAETQQAYEAAAEAFEKIKEFREADALAQACRTKAEEIRKETVYQKGLADMQIGEPHYLRNAMQAFSSIPDWKNAAQLEEECRQLVIAREEQRKEYLYARCIKWMDQNTIESTKQAIEGFRSISEWKDSAKLAQLCAERLETLQRERIQEQMRLDEKRSKRRKIKKIALLLAVPVLLLVIFVGYPLFGYLTGDYATYIKGFNASEFTIPDGDVSIAPGAFSGCASLKSVTIPDSVTTIGDHAFDNCTSLESVTIPDSVTSIGDYAFRNCTSLESVLIPDSVTTIGDYAFSNCAFLDSVTIGDSVTTIGDNAFEFCNFLGLVTIPDNVTTIGDYAFAHCDSLMSMTIPDSVTTIGNYAFAFGDALTSVTIPDSVTTIGENAFYSCAALTDVYFAGTREQWQDWLVYFGHSVTVYCSDGVYTEH